MGALNRMLNAKPGLVYTRFLNLRKRRRIVFTMLRHISQDSIFRKRQILRWRGSHPCLFYLPLARPLGGFDPCLFVSGQPLQDGPRVGNIPLSFQKISKY